ncbi:General transcription factor IIF subunit 1 [Heterocephalus glaber]|uniref:Transcription initiation factor IIF subunit alpha n=1 Tax=Heterocephalus glaber TaxID=10181 RepID=G5AKT3_HETGA|nr:General transcription factor IIF subunit 1 [Heterocephalus glaber]
MAFNAADKANFATWNQAQLERGLSNKICQEEEMPEWGAGREFNQKLGEEARCKKYYIILKEFWPEDQPWLLRVIQKSGRKFRGIKKSGVLENTSYYIFTQCPDGAFEACPVHNWYNLTPLAWHRMLTTEEAKEESERRNKVLNHFSIMQQWRLKDQCQDEEEKERDSEASSALFMVKKTPLKQERKPSGGSLRGTPPPHSPSTEGGSTSSTLRAAATKLEQGKRISEMPVSKQLRLDTGPQSLSGKSTPQLPSGKSTPSSRDEQDLLKKFQTKKTGLSSEQRMNVLGQILKCLNPEGKMISDQVLYRPWEKDYRRVLKCWLQQKTMK